MKAPFSRTSILLVLALLVGWWLRGCGADEAAPAPAPTDQASAAESGSTEPEIEFWTCSMHPQIHEDGPGKCPICGMDLIPVLAGEQGQGDDGPTTLRMSEAAVQLAEVRTAPVERKAVARELDLVGRITADETRVAYLTSWVEGRIDRLFVDYTGVPVLAGDHMAEVYSPQLYSAQEELFQAIRSAEALAAGPVERLRESALASVEAAKRKLVLLGMSEEQVEEVLARGEPSEHVTVNAPAGGIVLHKEAFEGMWVKEGTRLFTIADLSKVWLMLDAYESDLVWLRYGQQVAFEVDAYPGETFHGRIAFVSPDVDPRKRTVPVRIDVVNDDLRLKPDMFARARVRSVLTADGRAVDPDLEGKWMCPMHPEVVADGPGTCPECGMALRPVEELGFAVPQQEELPLVIPQTAPLLTGKRAVVYVRRPGEEPIFEGRQVVLGPRAEGHYIVREGLAEGELVVERGAFAIDAELQLRGKVSMMQPEEEEASVAPEDEEHAAMRLPDGLAEAVVAAVAATRPVAEALVQDDAEAAKAAAPALETALRDLADADVPAMLEDFVRPRVRRALEALPHFQHGDLAMSRMALRSVEEALMELASAGGAPIEESGFAVYHCPMAFDEGADWIQEAGTPVSNPYMGQDMPRCGDELRPLGPQD